VCHSQTCNGYGNPSRHVTHCFVNPKDHAFAIDNAQGKQYGKAGTRIDLATGNESFLSTATMMPWVTVLRVTISIDV
jgi:hypothetical protein